MDKTVKNIAQSDFAFHFTRYKSYMII